MRPITISEVQCFQRCEREWQHRYLDRRDGLIPAETLSRGKRIHTSLAPWWASGGIAPREPVPVERAMLFGYDARYERPHLHHVRVNVPFRVTIGGVNVVGECDAVGFNDDGDEVVVEHKTTTRDITLGSAYWREVATTDPQVSTYLYAFPGATVLYDVLRVPRLKPLEANSRRKVAETDDEYIARVLEDMAEWPDWYFRRAEIVRLDGERAAFERDIAGIAARMHDGAAPSGTYRPRNPRACWQFGRPCDFFGVCWGGQSLEALPQREMNHSEEVADRWAQWAAEKTLEKQYGEEPSCK